MIGNVALQQPGCPRNWSQLGDLRAACSVLQGQRSGLQCWPNISCWRAVHYPRWLHLGKALATEVFTLIAAAFTDAPPSLSLT